MAAVPDHRRRGGDAAAVVVLAIVALLTGCGRGDAAPPDPTVSPPSPPPVSGVGVAGPEPDFPGTAQEYAERTVAAWAAPDLFRLAELASPAVHTEIVELPGPPNRAWTFIACDQATSSTDCTFYNVEGDALVITVAHKLLGAARATTGVAYDPTHYPEESQEYVTELVTAWRAGNLARMRRLAVPDAVATFRALAVPALDQVVYRPGEPAAAGATVVVVMPEAEVVTTVDPALLGRAQAVQSASTIPE